LSRKSGWFEVWGERVGGSEIVGAQPANVDLTTVRRCRSVTREDSFTSFTDHIVFEKRGIEFTERSSFRHITFGQADRQVWDRISDHCPVVVEMWVQ
jgi:hypothetical protein